MDKYQQLAIKMKAMGHPTRLRILDVLHLEGEACVCHLENLLGQRQSYISQQLASLREAGLVVDRRDGLNVFYALAGDSNDRLLEVIREMALTSTDSKGQPSALGSSVSDQSTLCPCPKCQNN